MLAVGVALLLNLRTRTYGVKDLPWALVSSSETMALLLTTHKQKGLEGVWLNGTPIIESAGRIRLAGCSRDGTA
jgi:hypothetical protein